MPDVWVYFDVVSPFSHLCISLLNKYNSTIWNGAVNIKLRPVLLGGILKACGTSPLSLPARATYNFRDVQRYADWMGVELKMPPNFPFRTITLGRFLTSVRLTDEARLLPAIMAIFQHIFEHGANPEAEEFVVGALKGVFSESEVTHHWAAKDHKEVKAAFTKETDDAVEMGVFGVPTMVVTNEDGSLERFWGVDRVEMLARHLHLPSALSKL